MTPISTDWRAVNSAGVVLYSFGDRDSGRKWVRENAYRHDGLRLEKVVVSVQTDYRPRMPRKIQPMMQEAMA